MLKVLKVTGDSLSPFFLEGDFVVVSKIPFFLRRPRPGDVVVFQHPDYGTLIKRLERLSPDGEQVYVVGEHPLSTDSRKFGPLPRRLLQGVVIWHIRKPS
jgi:nickel-type superoxide dismutase maturation protease